VFHVAYKRCRIAVIFSYVDSNIGVHLWVPATVVLSSIKH